MATSIDSDVLPQVSALERVPVHNDLVERLKAYISAAGLQPGDRLPGEIQLANQFGVARSAIREALRALEAVGAIQTRNGRGRYVASFAFESYLRNFTTESLICSFSRRELMEARCLLEIAAVPQAVTLLTDDDLREFTQLLQAMRLRVENGESASAEDLGMHRILMRRIDNQFLATILDALFALALARERDVEPGQLVDRLEKNRVDLNEHVALAEAVLQRNGNLAKRRLMAHFETTAKRLGFTPTWKVDFEDAQPTESSS